MIVFQLFLYSCVSTYSMGSQHDLMQKLCDWRGRGFYANEQKCEAVAKEHIGALIVSDVSDDRKIEKARCGVVFVDPE